MVSACQRRKEFVTDIRRCEMFSQCSYLHLSQTTSMYLLEYQAHCRMRPFWDASAYLLFCFSTSLLISFLIVLTCIQSSYKIERTSHVCKGPCYPFAWFKPTQMRITPSVTATRHSRWLRTWPLVLLQKQHVMLQKTAAAPLSLQKRAMVAQKPQKNRRGRQLP